MAEPSKIIKEYEELFGDLPQLPIMGNLGTILDIMEEAIIRKKPLTVKEVMEAFEDSGIPLDQGTEDYPENI